MPHQFGFAKFRPALRRLYWAVTPAVHGRARPAGLSDGAAAVPFEYDVPTPAGGFRVAVVCHLFYDDLASDIRNYLERIPFLVDIFISTDSAEKKKKIDEIFEKSQFGIFDVRIAPNKGRDISHKLVTFAEIYTAYDYVLFVHGKKSAPSSVGQRWFDTMMDTLVGSPEIVSSIMQIFERHPQVGIVMAQHFEEIREHLHWDHSFGLARKLAGRMGFKLGRRHMIDFPSGSMFWARTPALAPLLDLGLSYDNFPVERGQGRMTTHHAIERLFLFACERAQYRWTKVANPDRYTNRTSTDRIDSPAALDEFVAANTIQLLSPLSR